MPLIGVEAGAASAITAIVSAIVAAYAGDALGFRLAPFIVLGVSFAAAAAVFLRLRREAVSDGASLSVFAAIVLGTFAWLLWRARPDFLPTGTGSDLTHHL